MSKGKDTTPAHKVRDAAVGAAVGFLEEKEKEASDPWEKTALSMTKEAVVRYGPKGVEMAEKLIRKTLTGQTVDVREVTQDIMTASNILSHMQRKEGDELKKKQAWLVVLGQSLGIVIKSALGR